MSALPGVVAAFGVAGFAAAVPGQALVVAVRVRRLVARPAAVGWAVARRRAAGGATGWRPPPAVDVGGGPILLQVIGGQLGRVSLSATGAGLGPLRDVDLTVALTGIHLRRGGAPENLGLPPPARVVSPFGLPALDARAMPAAVGRGLTVALRRTLV